SQKVALDNALVPLEKRVEIGKCNLRIYPAKTQKESTYQVVLDALALTICYPTFLINKKTPTNAKRSKGINLLSEAAVFEKAQVNKVIRRSRHETTIHQVGGSYDGIGSTPSVPDEPKGSFVDTHEGTSLKPGDPDVSTTDSSESENESWGDTGDEANVYVDDKDVRESDDDLEQADDELTEYDNPRTSDKEEGTQDDEYVHTLEDYVPTDNETNDESKDVEEEECERINEELYGDFNIRLTVFKPGNQVKNDAHATQKTEVPLPSSFISFDYASKFLNFDNIPLAATKVVSMMDTNVQHEVPHIIQEHFVPAEIIERLRKKYAPQKCIKDIREIKMEHARNQQVPKETITLSDTNALEEFDHKTTLFETKTKSKSFNKSPKHRAP
nr:hypothetical protein [Tanacetum cinerariifolium]